MVIDKMVYFQYVSTLIYILNFSVQQTTTRGICIECWMALTPMNKTMNKKKLEKLKECDLDKRWSTIYALLFKLISFQNKTYLN